ncbi:MAG: flavodoxin-dependent (E)-4-hydroxy-3-methylbut-2-enyl-diphosphate synthase, partial [Bacteroidota bacterium]
MIEAGCELVRITAPSVNEARNLENIKKELRRQGYITPLVADIHFTPNAAEVAAKIVEKVRVNPGNYADKKKFETIDYTDEAYQTELERIRERFIPLVRICKENGTAMRIGTNHGSLSDRILSRYGDTPLGMVESAMEFLRICEDEGFHDIVLSMKASNTQVMVQAYRLLVATMNKHGMNYPLHLGVTEAGDGEDGRIKSAVGIGTLLEDGLGDTIRVSLTEDPEFEIPVARALADRYEARRKSVDTGTSKLPESIHLPYSPFDYKRRTTAEVLTVGGRQVPRVVADYSTKDRITVASLFGVGYQYSVPLDKWNITDQACDFIYIGDKSIDFEIPGTLGIIVNSEAFASVSEKERHYPLFCADEYFRADKKSRQLNFVAVDRCTVFENPLFELSNLDETVVLVVCTSDEHGMADERGVVTELMTRGCERPVIIQRNYRSLSEEQLQLFSSTDLGGLLLDGMGDGVWIKAFDICPEAIINRTAFGVLQATRTRISKTEYISCPS